MNALIHFHFLRPGWLWLLLPMALMTWRLHRRHAQRDDWSAVLAPHLLDRLLRQDRERVGKFRPSFLLPTAWLIGVIALAGPAWQREASPFSEDQSAMVVVLRVSPEMTATDILPSRLQRANHKIRDLLDIRAGTRNALVAYHGSAHLVMPLTSDPEVIETFAAGLEPDVMPVEGDAVFEALQKANSLLARAETSGSIVLVTDAIDPAVHAALEAYSGADVHILAVAAGPDVIPPVDSPPAPPLDTTALRSAADALGASLTTVSIDDADVQRLDRLIETSFVNAPPSGGERWRDEGWWLLFPLALIVLLFFRQGGAVVLE